MEQSIEKIVIYGATILLIILILFYYIRKLKKESERVDEKIKIAKENGLYEPVSLHPVVDTNTCIKSGACVIACPEKDILGIRNGKATVINASQCIGHGACFHACPTEAISLYIGTEKRGIELPHVNSNFETNIPGIYIAGEMGGMGLIKNAVEQGKQAMENLAKGIRKDKTSDYDVIVVGAGPAGISAALQAKNMGLNALVLEQDSLGGAVFTYPRTKIAMTSPMNIPLHGKIRLFETNKSELLELWTGILKKHKIPIKENHEVTEIVSLNNSFRVTVKNGESYLTQKVLLAIGRRGTPNKLGIPGEESEKVAYRLPEPELIRNKKILIAGGGDSAIESALLLMEHNKVFLSYRKDKFSRLKPKNLEKIQAAEKNDQIKILYESVPVSIDKEKVQIKKITENRIIELENDLVFVFIGGRLAGDFLKKIGIVITKKFGEAVLKHQK